MLSINISELIWTIINFFLLYFLLKRFLYDPVLRFTRERQARIEAGQICKEQVQSQVDACRAQADRLRAEAENEVDRMTTLKAAALDHAMSQARQEHEEQTARQRCRLRAETEKQLKSREEQVQSQQDELARSLTDRILSQYGA